MPTHTEVLVVMRERAAALFEVAPETIGPETDLAGLGPDSLALVEWVIDVEDALGVELPEAATETRLGVLADLAAARSASAGPAGGRS